MNSRVEVETKHDLSIMEFSADEPESCRLWLMRRRQISPNGWVGKIESIPREGSSAPSRIVMIVSEEMIVMIRCEFEGEVMNHRHVLPVCQWLIKYIRKRQLQNKKKIKRHYYQCTQATGKMR
jgi:hypothetical protein